MSVEQFPPGPTFSSDSRRSFKELGQLFGRGVLPHARSRFDEFGDTYYIYAGNHYYVTKSPDIFYEATVTRVSSFGKQTKELDDFLGKGLLTSDGELWRRQRRLIQPAFSHANIRRYAATMVEITQDTISKWSPGDQRDLTREMMELTLRVVCKAVLDHDSPETVEVVEHAMSVLQGTVGLNFLPKWLPNPVRAKRKRARRALDDLIYGIVDERTKERGEDLISQLLTGIDGEGMEREQLRDELVTLFLAGHETTALAMTWTFFLLSKNPAHEKVLHDELESVLGGRSPTFDDYDALEWARLVVMESMRIFPPLYMLPRVAKEDTELGGYPIKAGSEVLLWIYFMHHDEQWFPNPTEFRPQRFVPDSGEVLHPHAYAPFSHGARACIGKRFAMVEATLLLAAIAQRFRIKIDPSQTIRLFPRITLGPGLPIKMTLEAR